MPSSTPNGPKRTLRSGSVPSMGTTEDIKSFITHSQQMTVASIKKELDEVKTALSSFGDRVSAIEDKINTIMSSNASITSEMNVLRESVKDLESRTVEDCISELRNRMSRDENLIIFGLPENDSASLEERKSHDTSQLRDIFCEIGVETSDYSTVVSDSRRIGKKRKDGYRMLKVKTCSLQKRSEILRRAKALKNSSSWNRVFIRPDLTPLQQENEKRLRQELQERRQQGEDVVMFKGRVRCRSDLSNFQ